MKLVQINFALDNMVQTKTVKPENFIREVLSLTEQTKKGFDIRIINSKTI